MAGTDGIPEDGFLYHVPFKDSVADDYFSTRWFLKAYFEKTGMKIHGVKELVENGPIEMVAAELFRDFGRNLGEFIVPWIKQFGADCLVLGGNISKNFVLFSSDIKFQFEKNSLNPVICLSKLEEQAALFGSAKLCDDAFYSDLLKTKIIGQ